MAMGLVGAFGAQGGANAVKALREELLKRFMLQQELEQQGFENQRKLTAEDFTRQRLSEDTRQFDASLGLNRDKLGFEQQQYTEAAPLRAANLRHVGLQSDKLEREPQDIAAQRAFTVSLEDIRNRNELGQIDARTRGQLRVAGSTPRHERMVQVMGDNGTPIYVPESQAAGMPAAQAPRAVTGQERQTLAFFQRMLDAEKNARAVEDILGGGDLAAQSYAPGFLQNWLQSAEGQKYQQAQKQYTEARLRKESGAAIPPAEFENDRTMNFRIAGDKPDSLKQKRGSRLTTLRGLGNSAGRALQEFYGAGVTLDDLLKEFADQESAPGAAVPEFDFVPGKGLVPRQR